MDIGKENLNPNESNADASFRDDAQREQFTNSLTIASFRVVVPGTGDPFLAVSFPVEVLPLVRIIENKSANAALSATRKMGEIVETIATSDDEEVILRQNLADSFQNNITRNGEFLFTNAFLGLLIRQHKMFITMS